MQEIAGNRMTLQFLDHCRFGNFFAVLYDKIQYDRSDIAFFENLLKLSDIYG